MKEGRPTIFPDCWLLPASPSDSDRSGGFWNTPETILVLVWTLCLGRRIPADQSSFSFIQVPIQSLIGRRR